MRKFVIPRKNDQNIGRPRKKWSLRRKLLIFISAALAIYVIGAYLVINIYLPTKEEIPPIARETSTYPVIYETEREMRDAVRSRFARLDDQMTTSIVVPGLMTTRTTKGTFHGVVYCTSMTPQGMAISDDYIFISAYCHTHMHNSVIYMLDRRTGEFMKEIPLRSRAHVGGLAYDPVHRNLWVSGGSAGAAKAVAYTIDSLEKYDLSREKKSIKSKFSYTLATIARNSYMSYSDGYLIIGYFTPQGPSTLQKFRITEDGGLASQIIVENDEIHESVMADFTATTSNQIQSALETDGFVLLSKSYGPFDSQLQMYDNRAFLSSFEERNADRIYLFPQKMEQICVDDDRLYCLFESAAYAYRSQPLLRLDRIMVFNLGDILPEREEIIELDF